MKVALAGSKSYGIACLEAILEAGHEVPVVFTHEEDKLWSVARYQHRLHTAPKVNVSPLLEHEVDLIVGAHTYDFIGRKSRGATRLGALIGHPSLLPRHRGRSSVEWTVKMHDPIAGFTWFWADDGVDTGAIAVQDWCHVDPKWTASDLWRERLFPMGLSLLPPLLADLESGAMPFKPQDPRFATVEPAVEQTRLYRPELPALPEGTRRW